MLIGCTRLLISQLSWKTDNFTLRKERMVFMAQLLSWSLTSSSASHIYVEAFITSGTIAANRSLVIISLLFSVVAYWLSNFRPSAEGFWIWVMWLFLDLVAAESLVVFLSSLVPIFVIALAATAFANGLWMSVNGFMVAPETLNVFWRYVFHYIDYQAYVFRGMMVNEFGYRTYECDSKCHCTYVTDLADQCKIDGKGVLATYNFDTQNTGKYVGYMLLITLGYRLLGWLVMYLRHH